MTQYEQENYLGRGGGEVDDETLDLGWKQSLAPEPNKAPEQERPSVPPIPGPRSVNEPQ